MYIKERRLMIMNYTDPFEFNNSDLVFYHCGQESCTPNHFYGPFIRDHYLIHYVVEGEGKFEVDGKTYSLSKGQGFVICPNVITYYKADNLNPWNYIWVGFRGIKAKEYLNNAGLNRKHPIFTYTHDTYVEEYIKEMIRINQFGIGNDLNLLGLLYLFLSKLIQNNTYLYKSTLETPQNLYIEKAINYIQANYSRNITVGELSTFLSINRSYLYTLFKKQLSISPQQFLIQYRMDKACELMGNTNLTISQIARSVGYNDPLIFSKTFKKVKNTSPKSFNINLRKSK